jgi:hypothetical protein
MGIRNLNHYLRQNCPNSIKCINIAELSGKKIAVDISIYLYKYEAENALLENMYSMLSIFIYYNIIPIFIFDGKSPPEKKALLKKRRECRELAQEEYDKLKTELELVEDEIIEKQRIISSMEKLKKQMVQIDKTKIEKVKALIRAYGATYFDAPGEADEVCALLVIKQKVWACLSEDMDLFVYGCSRVLRYFSLISHTVVLYHSKGIYKELKMTHTEFNEICVLSGTDYNIINADVSLLQTLVHFKRFKEARIKEARTTETFYNWLICNTDYISYADIDALNKVLNIFNIESNCRINIFNDVKIASGPIRQDEIQQIMKEEDFIFCN